MNGWEECQQWPAISKLLARRCTAARALQGSSGNHVQAGMQEGPRECDCLRRPPRRRARHAGESVRHRGARTHARPSQTSRVPVSCRSRASSPSGSRCGLPDHRIKVCRPPFPTMCKLGVEETDIHHEADAGTCQSGCGRVRVTEDVSEKLNYTPRMFMAELHIHREWASKARKMLILAPMPPQVSPTAGLLALTQFSKDGNHLQRYRQDGICAPLSGDLATDPRGLRTRRAVAAAGQCAAGHLAARSSACRCDPGTDARFRLSIGGMHG
ncbi:hypothetical protein QFZ94_006740 [Paraburkholderia sp. JPY465]